MKVSFLFFVPLFVALMTLFGCNKSKKNLTPPSIPVQAYEVHLSTLPIYYDTVALLKPAKEVKIVPEVQGTLLYKHFEDGDYVEKGNVLFEVDSEPLLIKKEMLEADLEKNVLEFAFLEKEYERYISLYQNKRISEIQFEEKQKQLELMKSSLKRKKAELKELEHELSHCQITAPISGFVSKSIVDPGNVILKYQSAPLAILQETDKLKVSFGLPERKIRHLTQEEIMRLPVVLVRGEELYPVSISSVDNSLSTTSGLLYVEGVLENEQKPFKANQSVDVRVTISQIEKAALIPVAALRREQRGFFVYVIEQGHVVKHPVTKGYQNKELVQITEGLNPGEKVVTEGHIRLYEKALVHVTSAG